jgi:hypothetical protein
MFVARALSACSTAILLAACAPIHGTRGTYIDFIRPDSRPPLISAGPIADSLWGPLSESARGDGISDLRRSELEQLVRRFAPSIMLQPRDFVQVGNRKYRMQPTDAALYADTLRLDLIRAAPYQFYDSLDVPLRSISADSLRALVEIAQRYQSEANVLAAWYFDFPGRNPKEWWEAYGRFRTGPDSARWAQPTVYAHPFVGAAGQLVIQYWFFYPINDYVGNHEGDWEHINVVVSRDRTVIEGVHYFFHSRSIMLPQGNHQPEIVDGTHPVVYIGGRMYHVFDYPIRIFASDRNEGSHGNFPYPGEWEAAAGMGAPESVKAPGNDSTRIIPHHRFRVVLTPEPSRIDYQRHPEVLREWAWLILPVRWGFPSAPSADFGLKSIDLGNRAPYGAAYNASWNRTAPTLHYAAYQVRKLSAPRSMIEDLLQPWYYPYIFRTPRYVHDVRSVLNRSELKRLGLAPAGGWSEIGIGGPIMGLHIGIPTEGMSELYGMSTGISLWRNFWAKLRFGAVELVGGYQRFNRTDTLGGALYVFPITANAVLRAPDALIRPYATIGGGAYGWESRIHTTDPAVRTLEAGWGMGWTAAAGFEYYLRPKIALDVGLRYHATGVPATGIGRTGRDLSFLGLWVGHYVRF